MSKKLKTLLITGAAGNIGRKLRESLRHEFFLKLMDRAGEPDFQPDDHKPPERLGETKVVGMDLSQWNPRLIEYLKGVEALVHLAADPNEKASWGDLVAPNLDALNNLFMAATLAHVPRVVYFSSNHAMGTYKRRKNQQGRSGRWLTTDLPPMPGTHVRDKDNTGKVVQVDSTPYGSMKLFGERLGLTYAQSVQGVFVAIRSGWVIRGENRPQDIPADANEWYKHQWLSTPDLCQLVRLAIETPKDPGTFIVVNGMSDNEGMVWDIEHARATLGYKPRHGLTRDFQYRSITE